jgi:hypothetical protein
MDSQGVALRQLHAGGRRGQPRGALPILPQIGYLIVK